MTAATDARTRGDCTTAVRRRYAATRPELARTRRLTGSATGSSVGRSRRTRPPGLRPSPHKEADVRPHARLARGRAHARRARSARRRTGVASAHGKGQARSGWSRSETQSEFLDLGTPRTVARRRDRVLGDAVPRGRDVGMSGVVCTVIARHAAVRRPDLAVRRRRSACGAGRSRSRDSSRSRARTTPGPFTLAITGGTGKYRGAGGTARSARGPSRRASTGCASTAEEAPRPPPAATTPPRRL